MAKRPAGTPCRQQFFTLSKIISAYQVENPRGFSEAGQLLRPLWAARAICPLFGLLSVYDFNVVKSPLPTTLMTLF